LAVIPFGPWVISGTSTASEDEDDPEAEWRAMFGQREPSLTTGTAIDEFSWIYRALARETRTHGAFGPDQVDRWDITTVAILLGVGTDDGMAAEFASWEQEFDAVIGDLIAEQETESREA
jgi:hypothetical protein